MARSLEAVGVDVERDEPERLSADDRAARVSEQFLEGALAAHRRRATAAAPVHVEGVCSNCGEACAGHYCDSDCRDDHQRRLRAQARR